MKKRYFLLGILVILIAAFIYVSSFKIKEIRVSGCSKVDEQVIIDAVRNKSYVNNTIVLYIQNKIKPIGDIPFVTKIDIDFISKNEISVTVYEKSVAGCVEYMDGYVYFDKDGIVLESSQEIIEGIPCIRGLNFTEWEMGKKLPIDNESKFKSILSITQLIDKYELDIDGIKFTAENEIILMHDGITIELGKGDNLAIQMMNLGSILENLEGMEGVLYMKDFDSNESTASFSKKK
ncbi:MAG: cell division protein FtsQ/DivIB [Lachnospiraceae bacterium]|nr:cell division protein FtsQ/DivIB [Lachnospiraceae bacterium]